MICCSTTPLLTHQLLPEISSSKVREQSWSHLVNVTGIDLEKCGTWLSANGKGAYPRSLYYADLQLSPKTRGVLAVFCQGSWTDHFFPLQCNAGSSQFLDKILNMSCGKRWFRSSEPCTSMTQPITRIRHQGWWCPVPDQSPWERNPPEVIYLKGHHCLVLSSAPIVLMLSVSQCHWYSVHFLHFQSYCVKLSSQCCPSGVSTAPD